MKLLVLLFSVLASTFVTAQNYNAAWHTYKDKTTNMVSINSKNFFLQSTETNSINLVCVSNNGQVTFKKNLTTQSGYAFSGIKILKTLDNKLLSIHRGIVVCDVFNNSTIITKSDTTGVTAFQIVIPHANDIITDMTQHSDSSYYFSTNSNKVLHYSKSGVYTSSFTVAFSMVNSILALQNGNLLMNGDDGLFKNKIVTTSGVPVYTVTTNLGISAFEESSSGKIYALLGNGTIQTYGANLTPLNNSGAAQGSDIKLTAFKQRNDSVFCTGIYVPTILPHYLLLSSSLNVLYQTQGICKGISPSGITVNNQNRVSIVSTGVHSSTLTFHSLHQTSITGSLSAKHDLGVTGFTTTSSSVQHYPWTGYRATVSMDVSVTNFGTDTVKSFYLNHYCDEICCISLHKKFDAILPPNQTVIVATGNFYSKLTIGPNFVSGFYNHTICISTSVPNFETDIDYGNDAYCGISSMLVLVGMNELTGRPISFSLFPNPAKDQLTLRSEQAINKVEIITIDGRMILSQLGELGEFEINCKDWSQGIYFVKVYTEKGIESSKFIKN